MFEFSWGVFLMVAATAIFIAFGIPIGPLFLLVALVVLAVSFRYPYSTFYLALFFIPFLGFTLSIPTEAIQAGDRAFQGSIDVSVAELLLLALLMAWGGKILFLWIRRNDHNWRPKLPLVWSYAVLFVAHLTSAFSPLQSDPVLVVKFALRPVLFCYLAFIALPVNFIRSRRRLVAALGVMTAVGTFAALNGAISLFFVDAASQFIHRAHPLPLFGMPVLGDNHNLMAELLVVTVFTTLANAALVKQHRHRVLLHRLAIFQLIIGLLTFSRTGWIIFFLQAVFLGFTEYRAMVRRYAGQLIALACLGIPLLVIMTWISSSTIASSSNATRVALLEIAYQVFQASPWVGGGGGTFVSRVASSWVFGMEFGGAMDAHGVVQKLMAETGILGLSGFAFVLADSARRMWRGWKTLPHSTERTVFIFLVTASGGAVAYQFFNTNYWTGKMWVPIGLTLAAINALRVHRARELEVNLV